MKSYLLMQVCKGLSFFPLQRRKSAYCSRLAMVACPVGSIRTHRPDALVKTALADVFPAEIDPVRIPGVRDRLTVVPQTVSFPLKVMHLGFHSPLSFGATSYLIKSAQGNVMIDTPRFHPR
jgi:hypothetical protein